MLSAYVFFVIFGGAQTTNSTHTSVLGGSAIYLVEEGYIIVNYYFRIHTIRGASIPTLVCLVASFTV